MAPTATAPASLTSLLLPWAAERPGGVALRTPPGEARVEVTWAALLARVGQARDRFRAAGLSPGERIVLIAPTCPEFLAEFLGADAAGLIVVAVNPLSTVRELAYLIEDSGARQVVAHPAVATAGERAAAEAGIGFRTVPLIAAGAPACAADPASFDITERAPDDVSALLYTSGTTGRPKGAMLTLGNLTTAARTVRGLVQATEDERWATGLPLFHVFGLAAVVLPALSMGQPVTLFPRWDPQEFVRALELDGISMISGVPTMWMSVLAGASEGTAPALRAVSSGGAAIAGEVVRRFEERFSAPVVEGYGLTETTALGTFNPIDGERKVGSVGRPVGEQEVRVIGLDGSPVPAGEVGEVCIRGPVVMKGYWNRPEATAEVLSPDGWFRTGDLGRMDSDGYLFIVDRLKDLIIHGGYNVYPREVEEVLYEIPGVREAAVVGTPDEKYGQQVTAVLTRTADDAGAALTAEAVERAAREALAAYKIPRIVEFVEELPKGPSGKILKRALSGLGAERKDTGQPVAPVGT
ncbi:class I adenylate-forming enzyme family protein [Brevibacterium album]|uniref:class I adenylate-forming enzyme family protein n=1 Tax=Brevibacterium album TaxID=417948 RepID=UPI00041B83F3|nr:AMP-binding protein [Brevibacterium album]